MKVAIHQPNFLPWPGFFYKMAKSDIFVLLDNVQYEKNGPTNRTKIKTSRGKSWLTLPVSQKFPQTIKEIELVNFENERNKILKTIELNYKKSKHFDFLFPEINNIFQKDWKRLSELNTELIKLLKEKLGIKTKLEIASDFKVAGKRDDLLINLCKYLGETFIFLAGEEKNIKMKTNLRILELN